MDEKKDTERRERPNRIISPEFGMAIEGAAEQPLQIIAAVAHLKLPRLKCIMRRGVLVSRDVYPLLKLAQLIEFKGQIFEEF